MEIYFSKHFWNNGGDLCMPMMKMKPTVTMAMFQDIQGAEIRTFRYLDTRLLFLGIFIYRAGKLH